MTVAELITILHSFPQDLPVVYRCCSENCLLEHGDLEVREECEPRDDGWVPNKRPDKPTRTYLVFPGN